MLVNRADVESANARLGRSSTGWANEIMRVAQYHVVLDTLGKEECRERVFLLKKTFLVAISETKIGCGPWQLKNG